MKKYLGLIVLLIFCWTAQAHAQAVSPEKRNLLNGGLGCFTFVSTSTTLLELTGCPVVAGTTYYITDVIFSSSVISSTAADSQMTLKYGTGTNCGTGTVVVWVASNLASTTVNTPLQSPIRIPKGNAICWIHSPGGTKSVQVLGYREF